METGGSQPLIARLWHGWASAENADDYEALLRSEVLPGIDRIDGYRGAYMLRRPSSEGFEFATITFWDSVEALRKFAGEDFQVAVVPPEAGKLLSRFDERSAHYDVIIEPPAAGAATSD